jgi:tRNA pseudouridine38-40 synthase
MEPEQYGTGRRIALLLQYDGTPFCGFQLQDEGDTIQGAIEGALKILLKHDCRITVAGRTDAGVHALGQVAHFNTSSQIGLQRLCIGLNGIMPPSISIKNAYDVPERFHARFSAVSREYRFVIYNSPLRSPFMAYRAMWVTDSLNLDYLREASSYLTGEHDFASFCKKISADAGTVRFLESIKIDQRDEYIFITFKGNAFLHNMIRIIVGTLVAMHKEGRPPDFMKEIINAKNRDAAGATAPPYGLYMKKICYDPALDTYGSAY